MQKDSILNYYNEELAYLRQHGEAFAKAYPKTASRLRLGPGNTEDPFVGRMIESCAFLTARLRQKIDSQTKDLSQAIIQALYPHYLLPIPALSIVQFSPHENLSKPYTIPKNTKLESKTPLYESCLFSSCYELTLWPINIQHTQYRIEVPAALLQDKAAKSVLSLHIKSSKNDVKLNELCPEKLRFYINLSEEYAYTLQAALLSNTIQILMTSPDLHHKTALPSHAIQAVGFNDQENLLPYPAQSFKGYRLLTEWFHFPRKFLFFDLHLERSNFLSEFETDLCIHFVFNSCNPELDHVVNEHALMLGCTPIINLFEQTGEPIQVDGKHYEYHVIADAHRPKESIEIYSIESIAHVSNEPLPCRPLFGKKFAQVTEPCLYWETKRKYAWEIDCPMMVGSETFIRLHQDQHQITLLSPTLLCTNRDLPSHLPFGGDEPRFSLLQHQSMVSKIHCLSSITLPKYRQFASEQDLIAHLNVSQINLSDPKQSLSSLKELLALYCYDDAAQLSALENGLLSLYVSNVFERHPTGLKQGLCSGLEFCLSVDERCFLPNQAITFGSIIEQFLSRFCSVNSFTRLIIHSKQRGELFTWPARFGHQKAL